MNIWAKRTLVVLSMGGGIFGLVVVLLSLLRGGVSIATGLILIAAMGAYSLGLIGGIKLIGNTDAGLRWLRAYFALQIPVVSSPVLSYFVASGAAVNVGWVQARLFLTGRLGTEFEFTFFVSRPWGIGVNLVGLLLFLWTQSLYKRFRSPEDVEATNAGQGGWTW